MKKLTLILFLIFSLNITAQTWDVNFSDSLTNYGSSTANILDFYNYKDSVLYITGGIMFIGTDSTISTFHMDSDYTFVPYKVPVHEWLNKFIYDPQGNCVIKYKNKLIAGGGFKLRSYWNDYYIAKYLAYQVDSMNWGALGGYHPNGTVNDLVEYNGKLIMAGFFDGVGGFDTLDNYTHLMDVLHIVAYSDTGGYENIANVTTVEYFALGVHDGNLYTGGYHGLRQYLGGEDWDVEPHGGVNGTVHDMVTDTFNNFLYIGGAFYYVADTIQTYNIAMWDGFNWHAIGTDSGLSVGEKGMAVYHGDLYIGSGWLSAIGGEDFNRIARWDGENWSKVGNGIENGSVYTIEEFRDELYFGGTFTEVKSYSIGDSIVPAQRAYGIARWHMPDTNCSYMRPMVQTYSDTFYLENGQAVAQLYNNNKYVDSWSWDFGDGETDTVQNPLHVYTDTGVYTVQVVVTDANCPKTKIAHKQIVVVNSSSVSKLAISNSQLTIYPNPSDSKFTIETELPQGSIGEIRVYGISGKEVKTIQIENQKTKTSIDVSHWQKGNYLCSLFVNGKLVKSKKMVVN